MAALSFGPTRAVLDRVLPAPGTGPDEKARRNGHFRVEVVTVTSTGARYVATVAAKGDPGYQATSVMHGEAALALALDRERLPDRVGRPDARLGDRPGAGGPAAGARVRGQRPARRLIAAAPPSATAPVSGSSRSRPVAGS